MLFYGRRRHAWLKLSKEILRLRCSRRRRSKQSDRFASHTQECKRISLANINIYDSKQHSERERGERNEQIATSSEMMIAAKKYVLAQSKRKQESER